MATSQLLASMPLVTLDNGMTVTFEAIDPDTGAAVTGVVISDATIKATNVVPSPAPAEPEPEYVWGAG